jgi:hypothetical protein
MALHISTKDDIATAQAVTARIATGQMAADLPKADHVARTPVPPFLADSASKPLQAPTSPVPPAPLHLAFASAENAKWWLEHLAALMAEPVQGCATPPKSPKPPNLAVVKPAPVLVPMVLNREWLDVWRKVHAPTEESAFVSRIEAERNRVKLTALMRDLSMGRTPEPFILPAIELERAA